MPRPAGSEEQSKKYSYSLEVPRSVASRPSMCVLARRVPHTAHSKDMNES